MITLTVNGHEDQFEPPLNVSSLLERLEVKAPALAVEVNKAIVKRDDYDSHQLVSGDRVEIVTFVGGG